MRFAYADPPYRRQAKKHYRADPNCAEVNQQILINHLVDYFPDGWALSMGSNDLRELLPMCPAGVRVMPWVKPYATWKKGVPITYAWEPVIVWGGRKRGPVDFGVKDWVSANQEVGRGVAGAKPPAFCHWLFDVLNIWPCDELADLFPGTGGVTQAFQTWCAYQESRFDYQVR